MRWHVHIYHVLEMTEVNIDAASIVEARQLALKNHSQFPKKSADCSRLALAFPVRDGDAKFTLDK